VTSADVLAQWLAAAEPESASLERVPRGRPLPTSYAQRGFWFGHQIGGADSTAFLARHVYRLRGPLDVDALAAALDALVARHEILRTTFVELDAEPWQVVNEPRSLRLRPEPLPDEAEFDRALRPPLDLAKGPLFFGRLFRIHDEEHLLLLVVHHILNDAWSMDVVHRELAALYEAELTGEPAGLPELGVHYADFAEWQHRELGAATAAEGLEFWRRHLEGAPPVLSLRSSRPRPPVQSFEGDWLTFDLDAPLAAAVSEHARATRTTQFAVLLGALAVALARLSGRDDLVIGVPAVHRPLPETDEMIGPFMNILPLRFRLAGAPSVGAAVELAASLVREATAHEAVPFELVVRELGVPHDPAHNPIVQVLVSSHQGLLEPLALHGLQVEYVPTWPKDAQRDLTLVLQSEPEGTIHAAIWYATDLYDDAAAQELADALTTALHEAVETPAKLIELEAWPPLREPPPAADEPALPLAGPAASLVVAAWRDVLGREELDAGSHFFRLGGTSMSAMRLCARLTETLGAKIPIRAVFECPRLGSFAARVEELRAAAGG